MFHNLAPSSILPTRSMLGLIATLHVEGPITNLLRLIEDQPFVADNQVGDAIAALAKLPAALPVGVQPAIPVVVGAGEPLAPGVKGGPGLGGRRRKAGHPACCQCACAGKNGDGQENMARHHGVGA